MILFVEGYFVGDKVSYADVFLAFLLKGICEVEGGKDVVEKFLVLAAFQERVNTLPAIKKYYDSQPYKKD